MISIVTPVYNGEAHIASTLESLSRQRASFEHLVMDAASKDNTCKIAESYAGRYQVRVSSQPDGGHYDAVQKGFAQSQGDILTWINAGDIYMPWTLSVVEKVFELHPHIEWITGANCFYYDQENLFSLDMTIPVYSRLAIRKGWHNGRWLSFIQQEGTFWRRSLWTKSKGADLFRGQGRGKGYAMDFHLWKRFAEFAALRTVCSVLAAFTIAPGQISQRFRTEYFNECGVAKAYDLPNKWTRSLFRLYSFYQLAVKSRAISGTTLTMEFPVRVI
jgi:glycosyltransferase involved in cell wall biosynthesis